jgi:hypothetical protein
VSRRNADFPLTIFTLGSARSGTRYLCDLFRHNILDCASRHEPFLDWGNPTMLGPAIYDAFAGRTDRIRERLRQKHGYVSRLPARTYLESNHAFLKSVYVAALEFFPDLRLVHLIRNPLLVSKSEALRETWVRRVHAPFHYYRGDDDRRHFYWSLTTNEPIYESFDRTQLTLFQTYLIQWIEIENRAMKFLEQHGLHDRCFTLDSSRDLNDESKVRQMFDFLNLETIHSHVILRGRRNKSLGHTTVVEPEDERQCREVLDGLPQRYLEVFRQQPYTQLAWHEQLFPKSQTASCPSAQHVA